MKRNVPFGRQNRRHSPGIPAAVTSHRTLSDIPASNPQSAKQTAGTKTNDVNENPERLPVPERETRA